LIFYFVAAPDSENAGRTRLRSDFVEETEAGFLSPKAPGAGFSLAESSGNRLSLAGSSGNKLSLAGSSGEQAFSRRKLRD